MASKYDTLTANVAKVLFGGETVTMAKPNGDDAEFFVTNGENSQGDWDFTFCGTLNHKGRSRTTYHDTQLAAVRHGAAFAKAKAREGYSRIVA